MLIYVHMCIYIYIYTCIHTYAYNMLFALSASGSSAWRTPEARAKLYRLLCKQHANTPFY